MATVILFHSVYGLRPVELHSAASIRAAGHDVHTPDLYAGRTAETIDEGLALMNQIGWPLICERAGLAIRGLPDQTVLAGISMGAGVIAALWPRRPDTKGILLLHGLAEIPENVRHGLCAQVHVASPDPFAPTDQVSDWSDNAVRRGVSARIYSYPDVGHFFIDNELADYDAKSAGDAWERVIAFLDVL